MKKSCVANPGDRHIVTEIYIFILEFATSILERRIQKFNT
jgi:hypothetical protein